MAGVFLVNGNPQNIPKLKGGPNMFYAATTEQIEQLYPDLISLEPNKTRLYYMDEKIGKKRLVDRIHNYYFSDKPWGLEQEYLVEGINQQFVNDDLLSLNIRNSIKAPDGWTFVSEDYSAEELRLNALNTHGSTLMTAFKEGQDVHLNTALAMFGEEKVHENKKKYRSIAKGCNSVDAYYATENGYKKLQDTDHILDLNGDKQKFHYVVEDRDMYRLYLSNGKIIDVTTNHKYKDFSMLYPEYKIPYVGMILGLRKLANNKFPSIKEYTHTYSSHVGLNPVIKRYKIDLNRELGYLIGLYLGDGYIPEAKNNYYRSLSICCHPSNADYVYSIMQSYNSNRNGVKGPKRIDAENYTLLSFSNAPLINFIASEFGRTTTKRVSELCYQFPLDFNLGIIDGLLDSDGKVSSVSACVGVNSELLARTTANLLAFLGLPAKWSESSYKYKDKIKPFYYVSILDLRYTDLHVSYKRDIISGDLGRSFGFKLKDIKDSKFNGRYYDKLNMYYKGLIKILTCKAIEKYIPLMEHNNYYPITIEKIEKIRGKANIMECESHYYIAEGLEQHNCNFGCMYGGSWRVVQQKNQPDEEAKALFEKFQLAHADHFQVQNAQVRKSHQTLCEHSFFGMPVRLHRYYSSQSYKDVSAGERLARNHRIQSSGADILSIAFIRLWNNIWQNAQLLLKLDVLEYAKYGNKFNKSFDETKIQEIVQSGYKIPEGYELHPENYIRFQITVHDEIDFIIRTELLDILVPEITKCMTVQMKDWDIPISTGLSMGPTFGQLYEWKYDTKENNYAVLGPDLEPEKKKEEPKQTEATQEDEVVKISF